MIGRVALRPVFAVGERLRAAAAHKALDMKHSAAVLDTCLVNGIAARAAGLAAHEHILRDAPARRRARGARARRCHATCRAGRRRSWRRSSRSAAPTGRCGRRCRRAVRAVRLPSAINKAASNHIGARGAAETGGMERAAKRRDCLTCHRATAAAALGGTCARGRARGGWRAHLRRGHRAAVLPKHGVQLVVDARSAGAGCLVRQARRDVLVRARAANRVQSRPLAGSARTAALGALLFARRHNLTALLKTGPGERGTS